jgi:hypothetical protein
MQFGCASRILLTRLRHIGKKEGKSGSIAVVLGLEGCSSGLINGGSVRVSASESGGLRRLWEKQFRNFPVRTGLVTKTRDVVECGTDSQVIEACV